MCLPQNYLQDLGANASLETDCPLDFDVDVLFALPDDRLLRGISGDVFVFGISVEGWDNRLLLFPEALRILKPWCLTGFLLVTIKKLK